MRDVATRYLAALDEATNRLLPALERLERSFAAKAEEFADIVKAGRNLPVEYSKLIAEPFEQRIYNSEDFREGPAAFAEKRLRPMEFGGDQGLKAATAAVVAVLDEDLARR